MDHVTENPDEESERQSPSSDNPFVPFAELPLLSDEQFPIVFGGTINGLNHVLGTRYFRTKQLPSDPIGDNIKQVMAHHRAGRRAERDWEAFRLGVLAMELHELREGRSDVVPGLRRALRRATQNEYFGARFEVEIAALLHRMNLKFAKSESPDFIITLGDGEQIFVECASANVQGPKHDLTYKVIATLNKKEKKPYANERTALFIDFTNILHNSYRAASPITPRTLEAALRTAATKSSFGAVMAFAVLNDLDTKSWALGGAALVFGSSTAPALKSFFQVYFPRGEHYLRHGVPFSG